MRNLFKLTFIILLFLMGACTHKRTEEPIVWKNIDSPKLVYNKCTMQYAIRTTYMYSGSSSAHFVYWGSSITGTVFSNETHLVSRDTTRQYSIQDAIKSTDGNELQRVYINWCIRAIAKHIKDSTDAAARDSLERCRNNFQ